MNLGERELLRVGAREVETGIRKSGVARTRVERLRLVGDVVADVENHGGPDQAVYLMPGMASGLRTPGGA